MKKILLFVIITISLVSCNRIVLYIITPNNVEKSLKIMRNDDKIVVFLPTVHLAKPSFYQNSKKIVDSLKNENYIVFYEEINVHEKYYNKSLDLENKKELNTLLKKYRKILGSFFANNLNDKPNKSLPKFYKNKKFITQTKEILGIDSLDINADISLSKLIKVHEKKYGEIILSKCDHNTNFYEKYNCKKVNSNYYSVREYRDSIVSNIVLKYKSQKSLIIFGKAHWYGIWPYFRDAEFKIEK
jgi:hypothetical protein